MTEPLKQIVYLSFATKELEEQELEELLRQIRFNNQRHGITGMLLYKQGDFIQALEGPESVIDDIFVKIQLDARHNGVFELLSQPIDKREFSDWSMGFHRISEHHIPGYSQLINSREDLTLRADAASQALLLMRNFAKNRHD